MTRCMTKQRKINIVEPGDNYTAIVETKLLLQKAGFNKTCQTLVATVTSELATNILRYANKGTICLTLINNGEKTGIEIQAVDCGPGIEDVTQALQDHYTTTQNSLGMGLSSLKRIMDEFSIDSQPGKGTKITAKKWKS